MLVTRTDLENAFTDPVIRLLRLLHISFPMGPVVFAVVMSLIDLSSGSMRPRDQEFEILTLMSMVHLVVALLALIISEAVYRWFVSVDRINATPEESPQILAARCVNNTRTATIVRLAILEVAAMIGLVIVLISMMRGVLQIQPLYWLNGLSTFVMVGISAWNFPSRQRLIETYQGLYSLV